MRPVILRPEDADYDRHSLALLDRIAAALQCQVEVRLLPQASDRSARAA